MTQPTLVQMDESGPRIRLLYCSVCKSLEELPPFEGRPENDVLLQLSAERHETNGVRHTGHLFDVALKLWSSERVRKEIIKQIKGGSKGLDEIDPTYYDSKSTFAEDALKCFALHLRPKGSCPDWRSERKRLVPDTREDRNDLGLAPVKADTGPKVFLCDFCPVKSFYIQKQHDAKGLSK